MNRFKLGSAGLVLFLVGIALFIIIVPTVKTTELGLREYFWAFTIIFSTCMGFGLGMIAVFDDQELPADNAPEKEEKRSPKKKK
jgi:hypothetical protein